MNEDLFNAPFCLDTGTSNLNFEQLPDDYVSCLGKRDRFEFEPTRISASSASSREGSKSPIESADGGNDKDKRRRTLEHKAELARLARSRKKNRLDTLEQENEVLRQRLALYECHAEKIDPNVLYTTLVSMLLNDPAKKEQFSRLILED